LVEIQIEKTLQNKKAIIIPRKKNYIEKQGKIDLIRIFPSNILIIKSWSE